MFTLFLPSRASSVAYEPYMFLKEHSGGELNSRSPHMRALWERVCGAELAASFGAHGLRVQGYDSQRRVDRTTAIWRLHMEVGIPVRLPTKGMIGLVWPRCTASRQMCLISCGLRAVKARTNATTWRSTARMVSCWSALSSGLPRRMVEGASAPPGAVRPPLPRRRWRPSSRRVPFRVLASA